jgi:hypothetical protein
VLFFICSCLVSSSPSKVGQFNFECCRLVQEISSVIHYLSWFAVAYRCVCLLRVQCWGFIPLLQPLSLGRFSVPPAPSAVLDRLQFTACFSILWGSWFWMLLSGSGDQLCDPLPALLWVVAYCPLTSVFTAFLLIIY